MLPDALEKLMFSHVKKSVFEKLGGFKNDLLNVKDLSSDEKQEATKQLLKMMEKATEEFFSEMHRRHDEKK